jgi:ribosomal protein S18 acetylase RimI-like enzyme
LLSVDISQVYIGVAMINDAELARRSMLGFGEMLAALGRSSVGLEAEVRLPNALGARIEAVAENPFFNAAIVPIGEEPPTDNPRLPYCLWTIGDSIPGRTEEPELATPCMGVALNELTLSKNTQSLESPSLAIVGEINERAYGEIGWFSPLLQTLRDERIRTYGLKDAQKFICVAMTIMVGDDLSVHYVATEESHRRQGLASRLVQCILNEAQAQGLQSATLQASADGLPVWERLGFRKVTTMRGYLRHG